MNNNVLEYSEGKVAVVVIDGTSIRIRSSRGNPLLLVDAVSTGWGMIEQIQMGDIDKIEILKNVANLALLGAQGANSVISILSKMGKGEWNTEFERVIHRATTPCIQGINEPRQFFSPKYPLQPQKENGRRTDFRPLLYWKSDVKFEKERTNFEFFISKRFGRYQVIIDRISKKRKIIDGTALQNVITIKQK